MSISNEQTDSTESSANPEDTVETEYKFFISDPAPQRDLLDSIAQLKQRRVLETTVMFDTPEERMLAKDGRIRVRSFGSTQNKEFSYKQPLPPDNGAKREIEEQVEVTDVGMHLEKILAAMGYKPVSSYERFRTIWHLENTIVTLDEYPFANYFEIEGDITNIRRVSGLLGFSLSSGITDPIDTLYKKWCKEQGIVPSAFMTFANYRGE